MGDLDQRDTALLRAGARMGLAAAAGVAGECEGMSPDQIGAVLETIAASNELSESLGEYARRDIERGHPDPGIYTTMVKVFADLGREAVATMRRQKAEGRHG